LNSSPVQSTNTPTKVTET